MENDILKRGFKLVEHIYDNQVRPKSPFEHIYDKDIPNLEFYRIKDVGNGLAENHWKSKSWLVDELEEYIHNEDVHIAAGWLGLTAYLLRQKFPDISITNSDMDPGCKAMGEFLFKEHNIKYKIIDTVIDIEKIASSCQVYINTSLEHIQQQFIDDIFKKLDKGTIVAVQSNNYFSVEDHVNCCDNLDQFVSKVNVKNVLYKGTMSFPKYDRYMVIGIV